MPAMCCNCIACFMCCSCNVCDIRCICTAPLCIASVLPAAGTSALHYRWQQHHVWPHHCPLCLILSRSSSLQTRAWHYRQWCLLCIYHFQVSSTACTAYFGTELSFLQHCIIACTMTEVCGVGLFAVPYLFRPACLFPNAQFKDIASVLPLCTVPVFGVWSVEM
jgi:hypothetical protein